jgi:hypothetical protein
LARERRIEFARERSIELARERRIEFAPATEVLYEDTYIAV